MMSVRDMPLLVCLVCCLAQAVPAFSQPVKVASHAGISEYRLANGLRVVLVPDPGGQVLSVAMVYLTGTRHEGPGESGMAHLMEHVMFTGTAKHPAILTEFNRRGASANAVTDHDRVLFYETLPWSEANLAWALSMEADRMTNIQITDASLAKERAAVLQEMSAMGDARRILYESVRAAAYHWHAYGRSPLGTRTQLEAMSTASLQRFYRGHYRPSNAVLVVGGPMQEAPTLKLVDEEFGSIKNSDLGVGVSGAESSQEPPQSGERRIVVRAAAGPPTAILAFHVPATAHEDHAAIHVLAELLSGPRGPVGGTYELTRSHDAGLLLITMPLSQEDALARVTEIESRLEQAAAEAPSTAAIQEARERAIASLNRAERSVTSRVRDLAEWAGAGDWRLRYLYLDRLERVDVTAIKRAMTYLRRENRTTGILLPETADRAAVRIPPRPDVAAALATYSQYARTSAVAGSERISTGALKNGLRYAIRVQPRADASATAHLFLHFGSEETLRNQRAVGEITGRAVVNSLQKGAAADRLAALGVRVSGSGGPFSLFVNLDGPGARMDEALQIVADTLQKPALADDAVERARSEVIASANERAADVSLEASRLLSLSIGQWPSDHVLHVPSKEVAEANLRNVAPADVRAFHRRFYGASSAELAVTGSVNVESLVETAETALGGWISATPFTRIPVPSQFGPPGVVKLRPTSSNRATVLAAIPIAIGEDHPDHAPLLVANQLLGGGGYASLLHTQIRGNAGAAYRVASLVHGGAWGDETRRFEITVMCAASDVPRVIDLIRDVLSSAPSKVTDEEIIWARDGLLQAERLAATRDTRWLSVAVRQLHRGHSLDAVNAELEAVARVQPVDVRRVLKQYLQPSKLVFVIPE